MKAYYTLWPDVFFFCFKLSMWSDFQCRCSDKCHQSWWTCTNFIHFCSLATFINTGIRKRTLLIEFQYKYGRKHKILWIKSLRRILYFLFKRNKKIRFMYELNEKAPVIMVSLIFHHRFKIESVTWRKIARSPQVLRKHITWRNFLKESLARNKVFKIFMKQVNEKAYLILISLFFHQNFE